jgi:hypothetical protein
MANVADVYQDFWLRPEFLGGRAVTVEIAGVDVVEVFNPARKRNEAKLALSFTGKRLRMLVNKSQAASLVRIAGGELDFSKWAGLKVTLSEGLAPNNKPTLVITPAPESN